MFPPTPKIEIYIHNGPNTLFSPYLMIVITGTFRNTSCPSKLYESTQFLTVDLLIIEFPKVPSH